MTVYINQEDINEKIDAIRGIFGLPKNMDVVISDDYPMGNYSMCHHCDNALTKQHWELFKNRDDRLQMIKILREITGVGLKEAKDAVDILYPRASGE